MKHKYKKLLLAMVLALLGGCFFNISLAPGPQPLVERTIEGRGDGKILLVDISGVISDDEKGGTLGPSGPSMVSRIREELKLASHDKKIKALVVRINTPGGGVSASDTIYNEIKRYREAANVPVYASIVGMGTSGGYYVASATDMIYAQPTAVTGSIGVIALHLEFSGLMQKLGISEQTYRTGGMKGMLSPFKPATPEESRVMQAIIDAMHKRFVDVVAEGRGDRLTRKRIEGLADGRPYTAAKALDNGLIDAMGYPEDVVEALKKKLNLDEARVIVYQRPGSYRGSIYSNSNVSGNTVVNLAPSAFGDWPGIRFMYLWTGH